MALLPRPQTQIVFSSRTISSVALLLFVGSAAAQDAPKAPSGEAAPTPATAAPAAVAPPQPSAAVTKPSSTEPTLPEVKVIQDSPKPAPVKEATPQEAPKTKPKTVVVKATTPSPKPKIKPAPPSAPATKPTPQLSNAAQTEPQPPVPAFETSPGQQNPLANPGTPSANVAPVNGLAGSPGAQPATGIDTQKLANDPVFSVGDVLKESPGVSLKQGNGPRDMGISIRGSNARNGFGVRNIVVLEDGFPVTQPDGLSRTDLTDPHAYSGVDVWRGPSSALFGNYATGGAINFRTRKGGEINGFETGSEFGSFNYVNNYLVAGGKSGAFEAALFVSDVRGDGHHEYSDFNTQTINALMSVRVTEADTVTVKVINNNLHTALPFRYSLNQFLLNPYQDGCHSAATAAPGCQTQRYSATGNSTAPNGVAQTAEQAGAARDDRRTIIGTRWDHKFDADSSWRVQYVADDRNIRQPTSNTSAKGDFFSHNITTDYAQRTTLAGLPATFMIAGFWNYLPIDSDTYFVAPGGGAVHGLLSQNSVGYTMNFGARAREEIKVTDTITAVAGIGVEKTLLEGTNRSFRYNNAGVLTSSTQVSADRSFTNVAPELGILYQPDSAWQWRARVATGYGAPQISNLFVTPTGVAGNNTELDAQRNVGYDLGFDWTPTAGISVSVTGFYEFFKNELVSQSPGAGLSAYTFNAPASEHRGVEASVDLRPAPGWRMTAAYTFNDQYYTDYTERLSRTGPNVSVAFDRAGNKIPGVAPHEVTARLGYDEQSGILKGWGAFVEYQWRDAFFMENANFLKATDAEIVNVNVHYNRAFERGPFRAIGAYFEVRNIFDEAYIGAANNIANSLAASGVQNDASVLANTSGTIYSGAPRTFYGGVKLKF
jgi:iron complex outermembrane recepter protein